MRFSKVENRRAYLSLVDQVRDAILRGHLHEGDWLPSEREIAAQSGLSRSSVREALKVLSDAGLVTSEVGAGGGTRVVSDVIPRELLGRALEMSHQRLHNLCELRNLLELTAAELAAARATSVQIEALEQTVKDMAELMEKTPEDKKAYTRIDVTFHQLVMQCTGNELLIETYTSILRDIVWVMDAADLLEMQSYGLPTMRDFVHAVKRRDPKAAQLALYAHISPLFELVQEYFES